MSRPYISIGRGGPRFGVVLSGRDAIGALVTVPLAIIFAFAIVAAMMGVIGLLGPDIGPPVVIAAPVVIMFGLFWHAARKPLSREPTPPPYVGTDDSEYWERVENAKR
jgi:hypothetical protein